MERRRTLFRTAFGWCGILRDGAAVARVAICLPTRTAALRALDPAEEADPADSSDPLPPSIGRYFDGEPIAFDAITISPEGTPFQLRVWAAARAIPWGSIRTYGRLAGRIGSARLARAVGGAMARNPVPLIVPCHRVVAAGGGLGGFSAAGGVDLKTRLLSLEGFRPSRRHGKWCIAGLSRRSRPPTPLDTAPVFSSKIQLT